MKTFESDSQEDAGNDVHSVQSDVSSRVSDVDSNDATEKEVTRLQAYKLVKCKDKEDMQIKSNLRTEKNIKFKFKFELNMLEYKFKDN